MSNGHSSSSMSAQDSDFELNKSIRMHLEEESDSGDPSPKLVVTPIF